MPVMWNAHFYQVSNNQFSVDKNLVNQNVTVINGSTHGKMITVSKES